MPTENHTQICKFYRTKAMYAREQGQDVLKTHFEAVNFPFCFCSKTQSELGVDNDLVTLQSCSATSRSCYQPMGR